MGVIMRGNIKDVFLVFLLLSASGAIDGHSDLVGDSPVNCSTEGVKCENIGDNLIDAVLHVPTLEECRQLCLDDVNCSLISYFDESASPVSHLCQMFTSCEDIVYCSSCRSENMACYRSCGSSVVGDLDENIQDLLTDIESELSCRQSCLQVPECSFYTYFYPNDTNFGKYCFLQTEFVGPAQLCPACISAPMDCSTVKCGLALDGEESTSLLLNKTDQTHDVTITGWGLCHLSFLLVGGGGRGGSGGAGSGYLEYRSLQVFAGTVLTAQVGDQTKASSVTISGGDTYTANPGQAGDDDGSDGGDGYSGGGGSGFGQFSGNGGTNGGDGSSSEHYGKGGHGTGEDVSSFTFKAWIIEAGAGGEEYFSKTSGYTTGGGGGGVLVNGQGPQPSQYQGQGYGGGASGLGGEDYRDGMQGVILIEIN